MSFGDKYFEDFLIGEKFNVPSKTMTDAHFLLFASLNGDNHPIHYDDAYCKKTIFGKRVAHGLLVASMAVLGASRLSFQTEDSMVAFLEQSTTFLKPVFIGDTVYPEFEVSEIIPKKSNGIIKFNVRIKNQNDEIVMEGQHSYMIKKRPG